MRIKMQAELMKNMEEDHRPEEEKALQDQLEKMVQTLTNDKDLNFLLPTLKQIRDILHTSTALMATVPLPLKYLKDHYNTLKRVYVATKNPDCRRLLAEILSVVSMTQSSDYDSDTPRDCLKYFLESGQTSVDAWGHEYVRHLESDIIEFWPHMPRKREQFWREKITPIINNIIYFNLCHNGEVPACDLMLETGEKELFLQHLNENNFSKACLYLHRSTFYMDHSEKSDILEMIFEIYLKFKNYPQAMCLAMQMNNLEMMQNVFDKCMDRSVKIQLAIMLARQKVVFPDYESYEDETLVAELRGEKFNERFLDFARELDIMEPKTPEDVYKTQLENITSPLLNLFRDHQLESARQNLSSTFVNGFVNAGFCSDTLVSTSDGQDWIYRNKDHAMMSATASLGLINLWNIEGGLSFIDRYSYNNNNFIKSGLLVAVGLISCGVRSEYDAAKAYISEYLPLETQIVQVGAVLGLGLAYAGSQRSDIIELLLPLLNDSTSGPEVTAITAVSCSLICVGSASQDVVSPLVTLLQNCTEDELNNSYMRFLPLSLGLLYLGRKEEIEPTCVLLDALPEPFNSVAQIVIQMCAYAGTGDVLVIQEMLHHCTAIDEAKVDREQNTSPVNENDVRDVNDSEDGSSEKFSLTQAVATLAIGVIAGGEEIGSDMCNRLFIQLARYGNATVKKAVVLATAMTSISDPEISLFDILNKFSHDSNVGVACSAIFGMGLIGAGTNNARLAAILRQLAMYYANNPNVLFMVRIAQGLLYMGKGCFMLSPYQFDGQVMIPVAMAGLLVVIFSFLNNNNVILGTSHYFLYYLAAAIQPRWLITLDENLKSVSVPVRVGQGVCTVGKAGVPNRITGFQTHDTPVLLAVGERAELASDTYKPLTDILEGCVILRRNNIN